MDPTNANTDARSATPPQPDYLPAVEVNTTHCRGGEILSIPILEDIWVREVLPGAAQHSRTISSVQEAVAYTNRIRHTVHPANDDVVQVRADFVRYRKRIYNAMILLPHGVDEWQEKQWNDFVRAVESGKFGLKDIEAKSWQLAEEIVKLHEQGTTLTGKYDKSQKSMADRNLQCSSRMNKIIGCLQYYKSTCMEVMDSNVLMLRFIAAPTAIMEDKQRNRDNHLRSRLRVALAHTNATASASPTPQNQLPGMAPAAFQPQRALRGGQSNPFTSGAFMSTQAAPGQLPRFRILEDQWEHHNRIRIKVEDGSDSGRVHTLAAANTQVDTSTTSRDPPVPGMCPNGEFDRVGGYGEQHPLAVPSYASGWSNYPGHSRSDVTGSSAAIASPEPDTTHSPPRNRKRKRELVEEGETGAGEQGEEIAEE